MYKKYIRQILFLKDPETVHNSIIMLGKILSKIKLSRLLRFLYVLKDEKLENNVLGIHFSNPIGLSAGFDKNAELIDFIPDLGFGFIEVGSITANPCKGNPKPRLFRLVKDKGIIVNYGLANKGVLAIHKKLIGKKFRIPVGVSIAKTNDANIKGKVSIDDYFKSFNIMKDIGNYITINISCPNVGDGRSFEDPKLLEALLKKIKNIKRDEKILLKISPDIKIKKLNLILKLSETYNVDGFIISNLTKDRNGLHKDKNLKYPGGVSGSHVSLKSNNLIKYVYKKTKGKFVIIGVGGVFDGKDAYEKIRDGASLVQLITGMIYEGPSIVKKINDELVRLLERDGLKNIKEAIGKNIT